jgi:hypothetical protein
MADDPNDLIVFRCTNCGAVQLRFDRDGRPRSECVRTHMSGWPVRWQTAGRLAVLPFIRPATTRAAPLRFTSGLTTGEWEQLPLAVGT